MICNIACMTLEAGQNWDDLKAVMMMVRHGSLAKAAQVLGVNYTTVARRIAQAEKAYGAALFNRMPQGYEPTKLALKAAEQAELMAEAEAGFRLQLGKADHSLAGKFTLTAPQLLIATHLNPVIDRFLRAYPDVDLTVKATNDLLNLNQREADLAIRVSDDPGDTLIGCRLAAQKAAGFANTEVAATLRNDPEAMLNWIGFTHWKGPPKPTLGTYSKSNVRLWFDDMIAVVGAVQAGLGVARLPLFLGRAYGLTQVPVLSPEPYPDLWVVAHRDLWTSAKVSAFCEILIPHFKAHRGEFI